MTSEETTSKVDESNQPENNKLTGTDETASTEVAVTKPVHIEDNATVNERGTIENIHTVTDKVHIVTNTSEDDTTQPSNIKTGNSRSAYNKSNAAYDAVFERLKEIKSNKGTITVSVSERIRGGLRVYYQDVPMFLPASQVSLKRNPHEEELTSLLNSDIPVILHEMQEDNTKRKTIIVSRKPILEEEFWKNLKVGQIIEGPVSSIASFGVFVDIGGFEGLIHSTRLTRAANTNPKEFAKKGDILKAKVVAFDADKRRISLSTREFEDSSWKGINEKLPVNTKVKGIIRRITDFGAYIEVMKGVDGLLRTSELSWTMRIANPSEMLAIGDEIEVVVIQVDEEKQNLALSLKRLSDNPWHLLVEKYLPGSIHRGLIKQIVNQGMVVNLNNEIDGFMPRSKMKGYLKGNKIPFNAGETIEAKVSDFSIDNESLIIIPAYEPVQKERTPAPKKKTEKNNKNRKEETVADKFTEVSLGEGAFSFADMLSDENKRLLFGKIEK